MSDEKDRDKPPESSLSDQLQAASKAAEQHLVLHPETAHFTLIMGDVRMTVHAPLPDTHPQLALIGQIAAAWSVIEHELDTVIWRLAELQPETGACLTAQMIGIRPRFLTIIALCTHAQFPKDFITKIEDVMNKGVKPGEGRNRVIHDPWYLELMSQQAAQFRAMPAKKLTYGFKPMPKEELDDILEKIAKYSGKITDLRMTILAELSSRKPLGRP